MSLNDKKIKVQHEEASEFWFGNGYTKIEFMGVEIISGNELSELKVMELIASLLNKEKRRQSTKAKKSVVSP